MIMSVKDIDKFYRISVHSTSPYQILYFAVPKINQIQRIAYVNHKEEWEANSHGYRTTLSKLPGKWTVPIRIDELTIHEAAELCPAILDQEYSLHMLEDMRIRNSWRYNNYLENEKRIREWRRQEKWREQCEQFRLTGSWN